MSMPKFEETMLPILKVLRNEKVMSMQELADELLENYFNLTEEEKKETVSNGYSRFFDRVSWGRTYLKKAGLLEQPERSKVKITKEGIKVVSSGIDAIDVNFLNQYPSFIAFLAGGKQKTKQEVGEAIIKQFSPQDMVDLGFQDIQETLKSDLLEKLYSTNPYFFEKVVLILFQKMGYGDFQETSKTGDGGIDGIISQDKLGLEKIFIQAKRYAEDNKVREPAIRNFIGAMSRDVSKGIFVTTSTFDEAAVKKARDANHKIILIDGEKLTELMIKNSVGVQVKTVYQVKEIDNDFFEEG
ncbi:MAG: restriction endonuclease [Candidatus Magasanikbacteria bacterium]|nr:restriction endonuclease [Candidatus Magasanikbacteria bacterium]